MLVRIRLSVPEVGYAPHAHEVALACASLLTPSALIAFTLAAWNIAADLRWTGQFIITTGILSHWQIWFCIAAFLSFAAWMLNRYGLTSGDSHHSDGESWSRFS